MVKDQLQSAVVCAVKQIGYNNVEELQFEVIQKVSTLVTKTHSHDSSC